MTGLEDFVEGTTKTLPLQPKDILVYLNDPSHTSSFIQSILYEDSCAGVAVVDLFVAVKAVKDKMDVLARCNNDVLCKITALNKETVAIRTGFKNLMVSMLQFLDKINAFRPPDDAADDGPPDEQLTRTSGSCRCCGSNSAPPEGEEEARGPKVCCQHRKSVHCFGCLLSAFGERARTRPAILNQALLGSLIASLLWLHKEEGPFRPPCLNSAISSRGRETTEKSLHLTESNIQMVCDICEILGGTPPQGLEPLPPSNRPDLPEEPHGSARPPRHLHPTAQTHARRRQRSTDSSPTKEDATSDGESIFEEALAEPPPPNPPPHPRACHNVTCMGDLSNEGSGKKNVSTFTASSDTPSSWVAKLTDDIRAKLRRTKSKTNVTVLDRPHGSRSTPNDLSGALQFAITANTPAGAFDVTVLQYRKRRQSGDDHFPEDPDNSHYDSAEGSSDAGEDDLEEFLEIFVDGSDDRNIRPVQAPRQRATSRTIVFKLPRWPFFEIRKRYPALSVLEMAPKRAAAGHEHQIVPLDAGARQQREVVIRRSSSDLVIYIQVEVEDGKRSGGGGLSVEYQTTSHGTQTREAGEEKAIRLEEEQRDGESLYHIWRGCETGSFGEVEERERITFEDPAMIVGEQEQLEKASEREVAAKEPKEKAVTLSEVARETLIYPEEKEEAPGEEEEEEEVDEVELEEEEERRGGVWGTATTAAMMNAKLRADVWHLQNESRAIQELRLKRPRWKERSRASKAKPSRAVELEKALNLVREIENDVVDVRLSDAISILPRLESELRKHLHSKMKRIGEADSDKECSVDNFFSAVDFWPDDGPLSLDGGPSEERLDNLLKLLSNLEEAVKSKACCGHPLCDKTSSKVYQLLDALTASIRKLEEKPDVSSLSQTLDIASQLDTAVREYDSEIKKQPLDCVGADEEARTQRRQAAGSVEDVLGNDHLKGVRKKVFEIVEEEAIDMEGRIERDFDRLDRLEGENEEAMKFLEAFLQKTERRAAELDHLKADLKELTSSMGDLYDKTVRARLERDDRQQEGTRPTGNEPVRETISGLLIALDSLKSRARLKNEVCREILSSVGFQGADSEKSSRRSSRSSFTAKQVETMTSRVKDFRKIGQNSLYLSWSKPEGSPSASVMGYEIHVNGTLNQKVRNPGRLQAVLYSVDLTKQADVHLYAVVDSGPKILLATVAYLDGEQPEQ